MRMQPGTRICDFRSAASTAGLGAILALGLAGGWMESSHAASLNFSGQLELIVTDTGGGRYSGSPIGQLFDIAFTYGLESQATTSPTSPGDYDFSIPPFGGSITDGTTATTGSPSPDGIVQVSVVDGQVLDADGVALINGLYGTSLSPGATVDVSDIDTQSALSGGGEIVFGLAFLSLDDSAFSGVNFANFGPESGNTDRVFFFLAEVDSNDQPVFEGYGRVTAVPLPASLWLLGTSVLALIARAGSRRRP